LSSNFRSRPDLAGKPTRMSPRPKLHGQRPRRDQPLQGCLRPARARRNNNPKEEVGMRLKRASDDAARASRAEPKSLEELNAEIASVAPLVPGATRAVLGEGPVGAPIALVGEQPGDQEDRQ